MSDLNAKLAEGVATTKRVCAEAHAARQSWALFSTLNGENSQEREPLREATRKLGLGRTLNFIEMTFVREAILALFRLSDPAQKDRLTLVRLSKLLDDKELVENRLNAAAAWIPNSPEKLAELDRRRCGDAIALIRNCVIEWKKDCQPSDDRLYKFRCKLRPIRDKILAHAIAAHDVQKTTRDDLSGFLAIASELASAAQLIFLDGALSWKDDLKNRRKEAAELWDYLRDGIVIAASETRTRT